MENPHLPNHSTESILDLLKNERTDSAKERRHSQNAFLSAIQEQTKAQTDAMNNLGDRLEASLSEMRKDLRTNTNRTFYLIALALLIIAALGGLSVRYMDGKLELLQPEHSMEESVSGGAK